MENNDKKNDPLTSLENLGDFWLFSKLCKVKKQAVAEVVPSSCLD